MLVQAPEGSSKYDLVKAAVAVEAPAGQTQNPFGTLLDFFKRKDSSAEGSFAKVLSFSLLLSMAGALTCTMNMITLNFHLPYVMSDTRTQLVAHLFLLSAGFWDTCTTHRAEEPLGGRHSTGARSSCGCSGRPAQEPSSCQEPSSAHGAEQPPAGCHCGAARLATNRSKDERRRRGEPAD